MHKYRLEWDNNRNIDQQEFQNCFNFHHRSEQYMFPIKNYIEKLEIIRDDDMFYLKYKNKYIYSRAAYVKKYEIDYSDKNSENCPKELQKFNISELLTILKHFATWNQYAHYFYFIDEFTGEQNVFDSQEMPKKVCNHIFASMKYFP